MARMLHLSTYWVETVIIIDLASSHWRRRSLQLWWGFRGMRCELALLSRPMGSKTVVSVFVPGHPCLPPQVGRSLGAKRGDQVHKQPLLLLQQLGRRAILDRLAV